MTYHPEHQYRCTIIRGKSQSDMEDYLPLYANMVHKYAPSKLETFRTSCYKTLSKFIFNTEAVDTLSKSNKKTVANHFTEIAGQLLALYYPKTDKKTSETYAYESESCKYLLANNDYPTFFKNICLNFQFPNGAKSEKGVQDDLKMHVHIKPYCFVVSLLNFAQQDKKKLLLTKQEIGYYVLNNLDVLQGNVSEEEVYNQIMYDREHNIKRPKLSESYAWQHIKEQFNMLELANIIETDKDYIWLNKNEVRSISIFIAKKNDFVFDAYSYDFNTKEGRTAYYEDWKEKYSRFSKELINIKTTFGSIHDRSEMVAKRGATQSTTDLGDQGEALVYRLERERVEKYKTRLVNKVLLLGKTKGLGYDISSLECDENPKNPEFARYIEVKTTTRSTVPSFNKNWTDSINITAKEWVAAEQYGEYYNIYRVYFTRKKTIVVRIQDPFEKNRKGEIEVYPTNYEMNFDAKVIEERYNKDET